MMKASLMIIWMIISLIIHGQKPIVEPSMYEKWPQAQAAKITNDGKFASFKITNQPLHHATVIIKSLQNKWEQQFEDAGIPEFTADSRMAIFMERTDSLAILSLGSSHIEYIPEVRSFQLQHAGDADWLTYQTKGSKKELNLVNLQTGRQKTFTDIIGYNGIPRDNFNLVLQVRRPNNMLSLQWLDLPIDSTFTIWEGTKARNFVFDASGAEMAFLAPKDSTSNSKDVIWYYKPGMRAAEMLLAEYPVDSSSHLTIGNLEGFNGAGTNLYFHVIKKDDTLTAQPGSIQVDIWGYEEPLLHSIQVAKVKNNRPPKFLCVARIGTRNWLQLEKENERIVFNTPDVASIGYNDEHFILIKYGDGAYKSEEWHWNNAALTSVYLISTKDGSKKLLNSGIADFFTNSYHLSPTGKYVIFYNSSSRSYYSYSVPNGTVACISHGISANWTERDDWPLSTFVAISEADWLKNDSGVIVYDQNDIFSLDPRGIRSPINLTNGYGRQHGISFRITAPHQSPIDPGKSILLSAFDRNTKDDGFFEIIPGKNGDPKRLTMQPYMFIGTRESDRFPIYSIQRARDTAIYIVKRQSAESSLNYFVTADFKAFSPLSNVHPEKDYNWLTAELIKWTTFDGTPSEGILYKPEDFNPNKKYPIIFYYYERLSAGLHGFMIPELSGAIIDIPAYVSSGYLVFIPDIHYTMGYTGRSAYRSIISAALYLSKRPYIDVRHMGLQGHSFGGYETNYVVTHTHLFAAACAASGWVNFVSSSNGIRDLTDGSSHQLMFELGRERMGGTLWDKPRQYIENSPIFEADKVTTPLLLMNNQKDNDVPFLNGIEFFTALRRLQKKVWLLNYNNEGHVLADEADALDFHTRMKQFFDHYLKGAPTPKWMVQGVPAQLKGIDPGYTLEPPGIEPPEHPLQQNTRLSPYPYYK
jgi:hypothetical protein